MTRGCSPQLHVNAHGALPARDVVAGPRCQHLHSADTQCLKKGSNFPRSDFVSTLPLCAVRTVRMRQRKPNQICISSTKRHCEKTVCNIAASKSGKVLTCMLVLPLYYSPLLPVLPVYFVALHCYVEICYINTH